MNDSRESAMTYAGGITMLLGIWLAISSLMFNLSAGAFTSQIISAMALILIGAAEMYSRTTWLSWLSAVIGLWLVLSPLMMSVSTAAFWNQMIVGLLAIGVGMWDRSVVTRTSTMRPHAR